MSVACGMIWRGEYSFDVSFFEELNDLFSRELRSAVTTNFFGDAEATYDVPPYKGDHFLFAYLGERTFFHPFKKIVS